MDKDGNIIIDENDNNNETDNIEIKGVYHSPPDSNNNTQKIYPTRRRLEPTRRRL